MSKPVLLLAFANTQDQYLTLRNLPHEINRIREALDRVVASGLVEVEILPNATLDLLIETFQKERFRDRIAIFHYAGHAGSYELLLSEADGSLKAAHGEGLLPFLANQKGLSLIFLNGCFSARQAQDLVREGIPAVIGTVKAVNDQVAMNLAGDFYQALGEGASIEQAWKGATFKAQAAFGHGDLNAYYLSKTKANTRGIGLPGKYDQFPWALYVNPGAEEIFHWNLPDAAGDPYFALPPIPATYDYPEEPFRFLERYAAKDARVFFGRGAYIRDLYHRVISAQSAPVILLYGQSGIGKSSLLEAGLFPRLEASYEIHYLRRDPEIGLWGSLQAVWGTMAKTPADEPDRQEEEIEKAIALLESVKSRFSKAILDQFETFIRTLQKNLARSKAGAAATEKAGDNLLQLWKARERQNGGKPLLLLFDQVEEVFTRPLLNDARELDYFVKGLQSIFSSPDQYPAGKVILSYRKEYNAELEKSLSKHGIPKEKVFLDKLDKSDLAEVVTGLTSTNALRRRYALTVEQGLPQRIADQLLADQDSAVSPVLQIILTKMWRNEAGKPVRQFSHAAYQHLQEEGILLQDFLTQQLEKIRDWEAQIACKVETSGLALDILHYHTTALGTAERRNLDDLRKLYQHRADVLEQLIQKFKELYLLTDAGTGRTGLTHDTLAPIVQKAMQDSNKPGQRAFRILTNKIKEYRRDPTTLIEESDLTLVEKGAGGMRLWMPKEKELIDKSRRQRTRNRLTRRALLAMAAILITGGFLFFQQRFELDTRRKLSGVYNQVLNLEANAQPNNAWKALQKGIDLAPGDRSILQLQHNLYTDNEFYSKTFTGPGAVTLLDYWRDSSFLLATGLQVKLIDFNDIVLSTFDHPSPVTALRSIPATGWIITGARDGYVRIWNEDGSPVAEWVAHAAGINALAIDTITHLILSGGRDSIAALWTLEGNPITRFAGHRDQVSSVLFHPSHPLFLSGGFAGEIHFWDRKGQWVQTLDGHRDRVLDLAFLNDKKTLISAGRDAVGIVWDGASGRELVRLAGHDKRINDLAVSKDGLILTASDDFTARLWSTNGYSLGVFARHGSYLHQAAFSPDGQWVLTSDENGIIHHWQRETKIIRSFGPHEKGVTGVAFSPDGKYMLSGAGSGERDLGFLINDPGFDLEVHYAERELPRAAFLWNIETGRKELSLAHSKGINDVAISPDGERLLTASDDQTAVLWDRSGKQLQVLRGHTGAVLSCNFSPSGDQILTTGKDSTARLWSLSGKELATLRGHQGAVTDAALSLDGNTLVTVSFDEQMIWWTPHGNMIHQIRAHNNRIRSVDISANGKYLLTSSQDNTAKMWTIKGDSLLTMIVTERNKTGGRSINSAVFSKDNQFILLASEGGATKVYLLNGQEIQTQYLLGNQGVYDAVFSPDSRFVLSADGQGYVRLFKNIGIPHNFVVN